MKPGGALGGKTECKKLHETVPLNQLIWVPLEMS